MPDFQDIAFFPAESVDDFGDNGQIESQGRANEVAGLLNSFSETSITDGDGKRWEVLARSIGSEIPGVHTSGFEVRRIDGNTVQVAEGHILWGENSITPTWTGSAFDTDYDASDSDVLRLNIAATTTTPESPTIDIGWNLAAGTDYLTIDIADYVDGETITQHFVGDILIRTRLLTDLIDVDTAADTANFMLATPDSATGQYSGRAMVLNDLPQGTSTYVLTGNGASAPSYQAPPSSTDSDAIHDNVSAEISAITEKSTPVSADLLIIEDSASSNAKKKVQIGNLPSSDTASGFSEEVIEYVNTSNNAASKTFLTKT